MDSKEMKMLKAQTLRQSLLLGTFRLRRDKGRRMHSLASQIRITMILLVMIMPMSSMGNGPTPEGSQNPFRSRGASLVYEGPHSYHQQSYPPNFFFTDSGYDQPSLSRRQRQFTAERFEDPITSQLLRTIPEQEEAQVQIKELPPRTVASRVLNSAPRPQSQVFSSFFNAAQPASFAESRFTPFGRSLPAQEDSINTFTAFAPQERSTTPPPQVSTVSPSPTSSTLFHRSSSHMKPVPAVPATLSQDSSILISHPSPPTLPARPPLSTQATSFASFSMVHLSSGPGVQPTQRPDVTESKFNLNRARQPVSPISQDAVPTEDTEETPEQETSEPPQKQKPIRRVVVTRKPGKAVRINSPLHRGVPTKATTAETTMETVSDRTNLPTTTTTTTIRTSQPEARRAVRKGLFRPPRRPSLAALTAVPTEEAELEEDIPTVPTVGPTTRKPKASSPLFSGLRARARGSTFFRKSPRHNKSSSSTSTTTEASSTEAVTSTEATTSTTTSARLPTLPSLAARLTATRAAFRSRGGSSSTSTKPNRVVVKGQRRKTSEALEVTSLKPTARVQTGSRFSPRKSLLDLRSGSASTTEEAVSSSPSTSSTTTTEAAEDTSIEAKEPEISTHRSKAILASLRLKPVEMPVVDPCLPDNYRFIKNQPQRSFNHHLAVGGTEPPICDRDLERGWYRFESPAGDVMPTECPGGNYCGTHMPIWMKGDIPSVDDGVVPATGCINRDRECCVTELPIQVRNCSKFMVYHLEPTPSCNMGYCIGGGVPCPQGLVSDNGYTPCNFTTQLDGVTLAHEVNEAHTEVKFTCTPHLIDVIDPETTTVELEWWVDDILVSQESFTLAEQILATLDSELWAIGQEVMCAALAKHAVIGSKTEKKESSNFYIGLQVESEGILELLEGGEPTEIRISSTIPITCSNGNKGRQCCLDLELAEISQPSGLRCPDMEILERLAFPRCQPQICADDLNRSIAIPISAKNDHLINGNDSLLLDIGVSGPEKWNGHKLPEQTVQVIASNVQEFCQISSSLTTFDGSQVELDQPGIYTLYRHLSQPVEVQAHFYPCSLSQLCTCALSVRVGTIYMVMDVCTKGHLQVWASTESGLVPDMGTIPRGLELLSVDEGREYKILLPTGGYVSVGSLLTSTRIYASHNDLDQTVGLCGTFNRNNTDDFAKPSGGIACSEQSKLRTNGRFKHPAPRKTQKCVPFTKSWSLERKETLFAGYFDPQLTGSLPTKAQTCSCDKSHTKRSSATVHERIDDISSDFDMAECYAEDLVCFAEKTSQPFLTKAFALGKSPDFKVFTELIVEPTKVNVESDESVIEQEEVAQIILSNKRQYKHSEPPSEGWSMSSADKFCTNYIQESNAADRCRYVPEIDLSDAIEACRANLLYFGNSQVATLHLERLKEECRNSLFRNTSLWTLEPGSSFLTPPRDIADALCLNDCSDNGICDRGTCKCDSDYIGSDCSQSLSTHIHASEPPPPQVSALSNFGLCDTRTKPCREVTVLGDGLVNHEALKCNLEIYKIRGVASKQLVTDVVMTLEAKFISYQQVLCPVPELDIHHPAELAKLDFKDNTDHTRIFAKVSLSYGLGPKSAPLDLLLYDSHCWECDSAGECRARTKETRCFFAAGTSPIQVFRIGRTISTRVSPDDFRTCTLPKDSGGCDNKIFRYYYNAIERRCKLFVYGGCKGNANNFLSEIQCLQQCGDESALALLPVPESTTEIDTCSQIKDEGICTGYVPRFYFNKKLGRCELFSYGGCGGNTNNFGAEEECVAHCGGPSGGGIFSHSTDMAIEGHHPLAERKSKCNLPLHKGACHATLRRFYFDTTEGRCKLFIFGGCQGNPNNFETMEECIEDCSGPNFMNGEKTSGSSLVISTTTLEPTSKPSSASSSISGTTDICEMEKSFGTCLTVSFRYYYDFDVNTCKRFRYSGCGGNGNNFLSAADCVRTCGGVLAGDKRAPELKVSPRFYETIKHRTQNATTTTTTITTTTTETTTTERTTSTSSKRPRRKQFNRFFSGPRTTTEESETTSSTTSLPATTRSRPRFTGKLRSRFVSLVLTTTPKNLEEAVTPKTAENSSEEEMAVSTQTSRSVVVRANPKQSHSSDITEPQDEPQEEPVARRASLRPMHNRFQLSHSLQRKFRGKAPPHHASEEEGVSSEEAGESSSNQTDLSSTSLEVLETSASQLRPTTVYRGNGLRRRAPSGPFVDQVVKAPPSMEGSGLVAIRSYCRHTPPRGDQSHCHREKPLYFYNVTSAACEPFFNGYCGRSRNRFPSKAACLSSCIVNSKRIVSSLSEDPEQS